MNSRRLVSDMELSSSEGDNGNRRLAPVPQEDSTASVPKELAALRDFNPVYVA